MKNKTWHGYDIIDFFTIIFFGVIWSLWMWFIYSTNISDNLINTLGVLLFLYLLTDTIRRLILWFRKYVEKNE